MDRASPSMKDITGWEKQLLQNQKTTLFQMVLQTADQEKLLDTKTPIITPMRSMPSQFNTSHLLETLVTDLANHQIHFQEVQEHFILNLSSRYNPFHPL